MDLNCEQTAPRISTVTLADCQAKCKEIKETCSNSGVEFLSCIVTTRRKTQFDMECTTKGTLLAGRGVVFCKLVPKDCKYSEWSEWSSCSATCRNGPGGMADSVRIRTRQIIEPSTTGGAPCRLGSLEGTATKTTSVPGFPKISPWDGLPTITSGCAVCVAFLQPVKTSWMLGPWNLRFAFSKSYAASSALLPVPNSAWASVPLKAGAMLGNIS